MTHLPFIQQPVGDVLAETQLLSTEEFGAYQRLAFSFWQHGALPNDDTRLARIVGVTPGQWEEMKPVLQELFGIDWSPERLAERRSKVETLHLQKSAGGKKGSESRRVAKARAGASDNTVNNTPNETVTKSVNGSEYNNYNYNYNTRGMEEKNSTRTHAREGYVPACRSKQEAEALLYKHKVFGVDHAEFISRLMAGTVTLRELENA